jgi:hypothetical protein
MRNSPSMQGAYKGKLEEVTPIPPAPSDISSLYRRHQRTPTLVAPAPLCAYPCGQLRSLVACIEGVRPLSVA